MEANDKVLDALKNAEKPLKGAEIAAKSGVDAKEVSKVIKKLKAEGLVYSPKNCFYAIKQD
jgi:DNA-binding IscR family transcriptional regulator